jgi:hypothetical protein
LVELRVHGRKAILMDSSPPEQHAMIRFLTFPFFVAALLSLAGCDDAKKFVKESKEGYQELEEIAWKLGQVASAVKTNDFAQAKEFASKAESFLDTRALSWSVQVLAIEEKEGVDSARAAIERFRASENVTAGERRALDEMAKYYQGKTGLTGDLLVLVAAVAAEKKYGHGAGGVVAQLFQRIRPSTSTSAVSMTNTSSTP